MKTRKIISILICAIMLICLYPISAAAENTLPEGIVEINGETVLDSSTPYLVSGAASSTGTLGSGNCTAYYDAATKTLNLQNSLNEINEIELKTAGTISDYSSLKYGFTINVIGKNVISREDTNGTDSVDIIANGTNGDITITSQNAGKLDVISKGNIFRYRSIVTGRSSILNSGSINTTGNVSLNISSELYEVSDQAEKDGHVYGIYAKEGVNILDDSSVSIKLRMSKTGKYKTKYGIIIPRGAKNNPFIMVNTTGNVNVDCSGDIGYSTNAITNESSFTDLTLTNVGAMYLVATGIGFNDLASSKVFNYDETKYRYIHNYKRVNSDYYTVYDLYSDVESSQLAMVDDVTVSGTKWQPVTATDITVKLMGDTFAENAADTGNWITNLPDNMRHSVKIAEDKATAILTVSGTPAEAKDTPVAITIPAAAFKTRQTDLTVIENASAVFNISDAEDRNVVLNRSDGGITVEGEGYKKIRLQKETTITLDNFAASSLTIDAEQTDLKILLKGSNYIKTVSTTTSQKSALKIINGKNIVIKASEYDLSGSLKIDMNCIWGYAIYNNDSNIEGETPTATISSGSYEISFADIDEARNYYGVYFPNHNITVDESASIKIKSDNTFSHSTVGLRGRTAVVNGELNIDFSKSSILSAGIVISENTTELANGTALKFGGKKNVEINVSRYTDSNAVVGLYKTGVFGYEPICDLINLSEIPTNTWLFENRIFDPVQTATASTKNHKKYSYGNKATLVTNYHSSETDYNYLKYKCFAAPCETHSDKDDDMDCDICGRRIIVKNQPMQTGHASHTNGSVATVSWDLQPVYTESGFKPVENSQISYKLLNTDGTYSDWLTASQLEAYTDNQLSASLYNHTTVRFLHSADVGKNYYIKIKVSEQFLNDTPIEYETEEFSVVFGTKKTFAVGGVELPFETDPYNFNPSVISCGDGYSIAEIKYYDKVSGQYLSSGAVASRNHNIRVELVPMPASADVSFDLKNATIGEKPCAVDENGNYCLDLGVPKYMRAFVDDTAIVGAVGYEIEPVTVKIRIESPGLYFKPLSASVDIRSWLIGLPAGLVVRSNSIASGATEATLTVSGTASVETDKILEIKIPKSYLEGTNEDLVVKENPKFKASIHLPEAKNSKIVFKENSLTIFNHYNNSGWLVLTSRDENGVMIDVKMQSVGSGIITKSMTDIGIVTEGATEIKAMLWNNLSAMKPLALPAERDL